jgi:hypothetical protein
MSNAVWKWNGFLPIDVFPYGSWFTNFQITYLCCVVDSGYQLIFFTWYWEVLCGRILCGMGSWRFHIIQDKFLDMWFLHNFLEFTLFQTLCIKRDFIIIYIALFYIEGTRRSWLRHYATSRKVTGLSPDEVDFFNLPNPSTLTMVLGLTQPLTEMSTRNLPGE